MPQLHPHLHPDAVRAARDLLAGTALQGQADHLLAQATPVIHLDPAQKAGRPQSGISQIGGQTMLPPDVQWPTWDPAPILEREAARLEQQLASARSGQKPLPPPLIKVAQARAQQLRSQVRAGRRGLSLLATIDLKSAPGAALLGLPTSGILWFFADLELHVFERSSWCLLWRDDVDARSLIPVATPPNTPLFPATPVACVPGAFVRDDARLADGTQVKDLDDQSPDRPDMDDFDSPQAWAAACQALRPDQLSPHDLLGRLNRTLFSGSQSLGHKTNAEDWCRPRMYSIHLDSHTPPDQRSSRKDWQQISRDAAPWQCLFVFDSDEDTFGQGWKWGDLGQLRLWIHRDDLAHRRFDNTQLYCNTT